MVDLPAPKPFQSCQSPSEEPSPASPDSPGKMLLDTSYDCYQLPLPGQDPSYFSPSPSQPSPSSNSVFQFPPPAFPYSDPPSSPWKMPTLELTGSFCGLDNTSTSPMVGWDLFRRRPYMETTIPGVSYPHWIA